MSEIIADQLIDSDGDNVSENIGHVAKAIYTLSERLSPKKSGMVGSCGIPGSDGLGSDSIEEAICAIASGLFSISRAIESHTEEIREIVNAYLSDGRTNA